MNVVLITGSYPPDICGVADYTERLYECLKEADIGVFVYTGKPWELRNAARVNRELSAMSADIYHIQYPATGYGWKLGPQLLSLLRPLVVTIHECSQGHILRQLSLLLFTVRARKIIFTNDYERRYATRFAPWIKKRSTLIPIGNNVPLASTIEKAAGKVVTCFSLIRPLKGIEQVLEMARIFKAKASAFSVRVVGTVLPGNEEYYAQLRDRSRDLPIEWCLGLEGPSLSYALAKTEVAYLPFPDGASERRSSLIAMLANGAAVITTRGLHTPIDLNNVVLFADSADEAVLLVESVFGDDASRTSLQRAALKHAVKYSWTTIRDEHLAVYDELQDKKLR
jgi:glycosyltransferase involved in cell wall biosynthesis